MIEGTEQDHNLAIIPVQNSSNHATMEPVGVGEVIGDNDDHQHYSQWNLYVNVVDYNALTTRLTVGNIITEVNYNPFRRKRNFIINRKCDRVAREPETVNYYC